MKEVLAGLAMLGGALSQSSEEIVYTFVSWVKVNERDIDCDRCGSPLTRFAVSAKRPDGRLVYLGADCAGRVKVTSITRGQYQAMSEKARIAYLKAEERTWTPVAEELRDECARAGYEAGVQYYAHAIAGRNPKGYVLNTRKRLAAFIATGSDRLQEDIDAEAAREKAARMEQARLEYQRRAMKQAGWRFPDEG
jgi:hypothetical protein